MPAKTKTRKITLECPRCEHTVRVPAPPSGRAPRCPGCKETVRAPARRGEARRRTSGRGAQAISKRAAPASERVAGVPDEGASLEASIFSSGILGGVLAMVVALVWFAVGWSAGKLYFYPPVLFMIGVCAVIKALLDQRAPARRPRRRPRPAR
jgi:hypothetical protein